MKAHKVKAHPRKGKKGKSSSKNTVVKAHSRKGGSRGAVGKRIKKGSSTTTSRINRKKTVAEKRAAAKNMITLRDSM